MQIKIIMLNKKILFASCLIFTISNTVITYLIAEKINWMYYVINGVMVLVAFLLIITDIIEYIGEKLEVIFNEDRISYIILFLICSIILAIYLDKFLPSSFAIKESFVSHLSTIATTISLVCIIIILKRDFKYKRLTKLNEEKLEETKRQIETIFLNTSKVNENLVKYNPLYSTEHTFKDVVDRLHSVSVSSIALEFSKKSLEQIAKLGFLKIDVSFAEYTRYLFRIIENSSKSIIGSFTFRPKLIYDEMYKIKRKEDNPRLAYIEMINTKKYNFKIRFVILSIDEIEQILTDALNEMGKNGNYIFEDLPEIKWFKENFSKEFNIFWTTKNLFYEHFVDKENDQIKKIISLPDHNITDFAIFDDNFFVSWRKNIDNKNDLSEYGTLLISWNENIDKIANYFSNKQSYVTNRLYSDFNSLASNLSNSYPQIKILLSNITQKRADGYSFNNIYSNSPNG